MRATLGSIVFATLIACGSKAAPTTTVVNMPAAPMSAMRSAPPRGNSSAVTPTIVGHMNVLPMPKTVAAVMATIALVPGCNAPRAPGVREKT